MIFLPSQTRATNFLALLETENYIELNERNRLLHIPSLRGETLEYL